MYKRCLKCNQTKSVLDFRPTKKGNSGSCLGCLPLKSAGRKCYTCYEYTEKFSSKGSNKCLLCKAKTNEQKIAARNKACARCDEIRPKIDFHNSTKSKDGKTSYCKFCIASYRKKRHEQIRKKEAQYRSTRLKTDPYFRLVCNLRSRLRNALRTALKGDSKDEATLMLLGCSTVKLVKHLENLFAPGMTWSNYGEWHLDHIKPLCSFDLRNPNQLKKACHYTNLQPLWAKSNLKKAKKKFL